MSGTENKHRIPKYEGISSGVVFQDDFNNRNQSMHFPEIRYRVRMLSSNERIVQRVVSYKAPHHFGPTEFVQGEQRERGAKSQ